MLPRLDKASVSVALRRPVLPGKSKTVVQLMIEGDANALRGVGRQAKSGSERVGICGCKAPRAGA